MTSPDTEHRRLCHALFDAIEAGDLEAIEACYAPALTFWFNVTGKASTREENLAALVRGRDVHRRRTYNDRIVETFDDGFLARYTLNIVHLDGRRTTLWACLVGHVHDGRIVQLHEYLDSRRFGSTRPAAEAGSPA